VRLPAALFEQVAALADRRLHSVSAEVRAAVQAHLRQEWSRRLLAEIDRNASEKGRDWG